MGVVPAQRLLWCVFFLALLAVVAGPFPEFTPVWILGFVGLALVVLGDLAMTFAHSPVPKVEVPEVVRLTKDRAGEIPVMLTNEGGDGSRLRFALGLPATVEPRDEDIIVAMPAGVPRARIEWTCTPRRRGRFGPVQACVEMNSRWGFWRWRVRTSLTCEIRVYPNLFTERRQLAALFVARGQQGAIVRRTVGRGREFEKLRDYLPGDGFDEIHWKATAKRGAPVTKVFQAETTQEIYVVLDASRLSARPVVQDGITQTALERCLTAALVLLLAAERQGDRFGLAAHDDRVRLLLRAGRGPGHYAACREAVLSLQPTDATPDMAEIVRHLRAGIRRRALLFFLTDLTDPVLAEDFVRHARVLARQHLVLVSQLRAPGVAPVFAGSDVQTEAEIYSRLAGHARWSEARSLAQRLKPLGVTATVLEHETMAAQLVTQYLGVKQRQAL